MTGWGQLWDARPVITLILRFSGGTSFLSRHPPQLDRSVSLAEKLGIGSSFPSLTINLVGGGTLGLPEGLDSKYKVILFYRGHW